MKHTYLYPLEDGELWLWRAARMGGADLFGNPVAAAPDEEWVLHVQTSEVLDRARAELHRRLEPRDRVCIGRHYVIPGSHCETARERAWSADGTVRSVTGELWEAPYFHGHTYANVFGALAKVAGRDGRDDWRSIEAFCRKYRCTPDNGKRFRVVPVWM